MTTRQRLPWPFGPHIAGYKYKNQNKKKQTDCRRHPSELEAHNILIIIIIIIILNLSLMPAKRVKAKKAKKGKGNAKNDNRRVSPHCRNNDRRSSCNRAAARELNVSCFSCLLPCLFTVKQG